MLVLTRKVGEVIEVDVGGEIISVMVLRAEKGRSKIGIEAAKMVRISRKEIKEAKKALTR